MRLATLVEDWFDRGLRTALCALVAFALCGMPLAMAGAFRPLPVALLTIAGTAVLVRFGGAWRPRGAGRLAPAWAVAAVLVLAAASAAVNAHYSSEHVMGDRDPGIYLWHGRYMADTGKLTVASAQPLFGPLVGQLPDHCPSVCPGAPGGRLYVQFLHLLPATLASAAWIGGSSLMVKANALLGALALLAFFAFATRLVRPSFALAATAALAVNLVEVHFGRDSVSEILAQVLLFGGLYLLARAREALDARAAAVAGLVLGATCMVRIDSFVYLIPLAAYLLVVGSARGERRRFALATGGGLALPAALGVADLYFFSRPYYDFESHELGLLGLGVAGTVALGAAAFAARGRVARAAARLRGPLATAAPAVVVLLALFAIAVRPAIERAPLPNTVTHGPSIIAQKQRDQGLSVEPNRGYGEHSLVWIEWYLGPIALAAGVAGLALATRRLVLGQAGTAAPFLLVFLATALLYLWRPNIFPDQIWAMRRFLPVVIPGFLLLAALAADHLFGLRAGSPRAAWALRAAAVAVVVGTIAVPLAQLVPLRSDRQQGGALTAMDRVCRALPDRAAVLAVKSPAIWGLVQPTHAFCGVPVGQVSPLIDRARFRRFASDLRARGRPLALLATDDQPLRVLLGPRAPRRPVAAIRYRTLEQTLARRPSRQVPMETRLYVARP